jgi:hypothetical protein
VDIEEDAGANDSPKLAMAEATGAGRNRQATAAAIQIARGIDGREREVSEWGWAGSVDRPRPKPGRLSQAQVGRLGQ